jgi:hypothetical protein
MLPKFIAALGLVSLLAQPVSAKDTTAPISLLPALSTQELNDLANRIRFNETANRAEWQVFWSSREAFPSLGLGHFIWLPADVEVPFEAAFPAMAAFVAEQIATPEWLLAEHAPWPNRSAFIAAQQAHDDKIQTLQAWLLASQPLQMAFILQRFEQRADLAKTRLGLSDQEPRWQLFIDLMATTAGRYALVDYTNFKGWGDLTQERYQGQGWGLFDVLEQMLSAHENLANMNETNKLALFAEASYHVLERRVTLAPNEEMPWLPGWKVRTESYRLEHAQP